MGSQVISLGSTAGPLGLANGREVELSVLEREHQDARETRRARVLFLRGPRGVGRSHLLAQLRESLRARGVAVFESGRVREQARPFGLFAPMVGQLLTHAERLGAPEAKVAALSDALAPLRGAAGRAAGGQVRAFDEAVDLFALAGRDAPAFLFDDVDAADPSSLELLRYLLAVVASPVGPGAGLFVVSFRDDGALPRALAEVLARVSGRTLALKGLDLDGIRAFLARPEVAARLWEATLGSPEALGELLERPRARPLDFAAHRLARLDEGPRALARLLAAAGEALPTEVLARAAEALGLPGDVASTLDALVLDKVALARVLDGRAAFRLAREADARHLLEGLGAEALAGLRRAVGRALVEAQDLTGGARHLLASAPAEGAAVAVRAGAQLAARGAHADAAELYRAALPHLPAAEAGAAWARLAQAHAAVGAWRPQARAALAAARLGPAEARAQHALDAARALLRLGRTRACRGVLAPALESVDTRAAAGVVDAERLLLAGDAPAALRACRAAQAAATEPFVQVEAAQVLGKALLRVGQAQAALESFQAAADAADRAELPQAAALARLNVGVAAHKLGDLERAVAAYQATPPGHRPAHAQALANLGSLHVASGDFEAAVDHLTRALESFARCAGPREVAHAASNLARVHLTLGELERAAELSLHALASARLAQDPYLEASALLSLGATAADQKDETLAQQRLDEARAKFEALGHDGFAALAAALKAQSHLRAGERARAEAELTRRVTDRGAAALSDARLEVELARADLALSLDDLHAAGRAVARAREALLSQSDLEGPWRVHAMAARLHAQGQDQAGAQAELARAARQLEALAQRAPAALRLRFLSVPRRAALLAQAEPEARVPVALPQLRTPHAFGLVGASPALARIAKQLEPVGRSNATVLVRGESGTGKELIADALHRLSPRRSMPLVKVNCAAMVEELLLSELFGHEKGAFTGAVRERKGRFELADGGTLFLDEIGDISPRAQVALLRVLQEREFERVGGTRTLKVDVRVICATNRDLEALIAQGRFRADLYYRLKGVMLELPPLRERPEDLPLLAQHFLERAAREGGQAPKRLSEDALQLLLRHPWPGNVRELENVLSSAAIFAEGAVVTPEAFSHVQELAALAAEGPQALAPAPAPSPQRPPAARATPPTPATVLAPLDGPLDYYAIARARGISMKDLSQEVELQCIKRALLEAKGNISEAARLLGMKRSRLSQIVNAEASLKEVARAEA